VSAYQDHRGAHLARAIAGGKLKNQANLLRYFGKYCKQSRAAVHQQLARYAATILTLAGETAALPGDTVDALRPGLLNREGRAGACYWAGVSALLEGKCAFSSREHRGTDDPANAALNYGYGILQSQVWTAITLAGLEPFAGFIHVDRPGKPSLVLDMMEEFRQPVVDRPLLAAWGRGWKVEMEAPEGEDEGTPLLTRETRQAIAERVRERLEAAAPYDGKRQTLKNIIQLQARRLAVVVRGEAEYQAFVSGW
jgi:CRISPR-associated protein Cas1